MLEFDRVPKRWDHGTYLNRRDHLVDLSNIVSDGVGGGGWTLTLD